VIDTVNSDSFFIGTDCGVYKYEAEQSTKDLVPPSILVTNPESNPYYTNKNVVRIKRTCFGLWKWCF